MRKPGSIYVTVDDCPGFQSLSKKHDNDLENLKINVLKTDEINDSPMQSSIKDAASSKMN